MIGMANNTHAHQYLKDESDGENNLDTVESPFIEGEAEMPLMTSVEHPEDKLSINMKSKKSSKS